MNDNKDKIKKLYDTFVSDGYEMESEADFRKNLQDASKRKAAYDALVKDGYEMEAYDQFEKNLGFGAASTPAPKTEKPAEPKSAAPKSAKPKGTPLTKADKARMMSELNASMRRTQQMTADFNDHMSNMMEYGINLGQQTKKSKVQYNPRKRKLEQTYITPAGNRYTSKAIADAESFQYRQAADMSVSGQLRRAHQKLAELKEQQQKRAGEVLDEWKEDTEKNKAPLGMVLAAQTYVPRQQSDKENSALRVAIRETEELIKDLEEQKDRENGVDVGFWRGFGRTMGDMRTWDFGMGDLQDAMTMLNADKLTAKDATDGEKAAYNEMMGAMATHQQAQQQYGGNAGFWNRAGVMTGYMPSFMLDFVLTGGGYDALNVFGKQGIKAATKAVGKEAVEEMTKQGFKTYVKNNGLKGLANEATNWTIKALGTTADDLLVRAPLMTNTVQAGKTAADIIDRKLGDVVVDENGNYDFSHDKTWGSAIWQGEANSIIENYSEMFGAHLDPVVTLGNMSKLANVVGAKRLGGVLAKADAQALGGIMGQTQQMFNKMGVSDYVGEVAEEYYGQLWRTMLNLDDAYMQNPDGTRTNLLATKDFHGDIWGGMALSMGMMGAGKHTFNAVQYASMRHGVNKSDVRVGELLGKDIWEPLKATLDLTTNENFGGVAEAIVNDKDFTDKEKAAVLDYMERSMIMRGYNLASVAQSRGGEQDPNKQQLNESYLNGYEATSPQERSDAKNMLEYQRQRVEQAISPEDLQMIDSWEDGVVQADNTEWTDEQRDAVNDYLNAKQVYNGMKQRLHDDVDAEVENSNAMVDARVNTDTGMIQGATMKQDDRKVYVVSGNVVTYPDGTGVDLQASDQSIIVRDAETGELEQVAPDAVFSIDEAIDPNQAKAEAESVIVDNAAQKFYNDTEGTITLEAGNTFNVVDEDGREASVTITPNADGVVDNGDGTVNVSMDGTNVVPVPVSALQEMADAANMARVAQFEEQRTLENAQVKAAEQEAASPQYALNDEVTLRDENGNAVRGSISADADADGKYEVYTEEPINGARVNLFSRDELDGMLMEYNGEVVEQPTIVPGSAEVVEGAEIGNNGTENIPENGNIAEEIIPTAPQPTALERIPKDEQGQPIYEQTDSDTAWDAIVEQTEGDEGIAQSVADAMLADKEAELKKLEKAKPKGGVTIADKIAAEKERKAAISAAQDVVSVWKKIAGTSQRRKQEADSIRRKEMEEKAAIRRAEEEKLRAEREEAERIEREALNGVPDMVDDKPQDARARGYRRVTGTKVDRQQPIEAKRGKNVQVRFSDSDIADGSVAVLDVSQLQPSHIEGVRNPLHFIDEAQPKERNDDASKMSSRKIAANMRPEEITSSVTAYTGAPTVNSRGEVIQGNNRSDALRQMWQSEPEQAAKYKQYLTDHAEEFGLNPADIEAMERPVLVNMLDVDDNKAIELGQFVAQDTESGGTERIKPKNAVQKIGSNMGSFANLLLRSADDETSFSGLVDANGHDVLKWMSAKGYITPTQYQSAFDSKGNLTAEAKNDLKGIMYQSIFKGGSTRLEEMFNALPAKAQKAILATAYRDYGSPNAERMVEEIQNSIRAFYALMQDAAFADAKNYKDVRLAIEGWKRQYQMDDATGESYLPADNFSNFTLNLAALYKGESQSLIQATFNKMFDLIQGTQEETLFEKPDNTPRTLAQAIKETLNIDYNGQQRSNVLAGDSAASQDGQGSRGASETGERNEDGNGTADRAGGTESKSGQGEVKKTSSLLDVVRTLYTKGKDVASKLFQRSFFDVAQTPKFMQELGLRGDKFTIKYGVIARHLNKDGSHTLTERDWEQLPNAIQNPFAIAKINDKVDSYRIYTTLQTEGGEFVVIGADVKNAGRDIEVNAISTVFGRRNNANLPQNEEVIYRSKEITPGQSSLLERPNFAQYTTEQELSTDKVTETSANEQGKEKENYKLGNTTVPVKDFFVLPPDKRGNKEVIFQTDNLEAKINDDGNVSFYAVCMDEYAETQDRIVNEMEKRGYQTDIDGEKGHVIRFDNYEEAKKAADIVNELNTEEEYKKWKAQRQTLTTVGKTLTRNSVTEDGKPYKESLKVKSIANGMANVELNTTGYGGPYQFTVEEFAKELQSGGWKEETTTAISKAEQDVNTSPTEAQKEAGNYKKGHVQVGTFNITIENPKGSVRRGKDANGKEWESKMNNTYGYFRGTEGVDGDHIDVFLSNDIDGWDGRKVFVVDQYNPDGSFDEHKVMLGFNDADEAKGDYLANYENGWENGRMIDVSAVNLEDFEKWIESSKRKTKPFAEYSNVKKQQEAERKRNLSQFNVGDVVRDYYTGKLYRVKKFTKTGICTIAELDSDGNEGRKTSFNAENNPRFGAAEAPATTTTEEKSKEKAPGTNVGSTASTDGYSVEPAQYTTKRGKVLDMQLVKFDRELSKEETRNAKALAKELKGWYDKEKGGFMMRNTEDAQKLADAVMDESGEALEDAAPLSMSDVQEASGVEVAEETKEAAPIEQEAPAENMHKLVTNERYEQLKKRMMAKLNQLNMGIDPEMLAIGTEMAVYHIEGGARKFAQYAKAMIEDMGDAIRPYLKSFYNAVRDLPEAQELASSMDSYDDVSKFDVANFDKSSTNAMATAEMVVAESEAEEQVTEAKEAITNQRNTERRQKNEQTTANTEAITSKATAIARDAERRIKEATTEKQVEEAQKKVDKQLQEIDKQLAELDYVNSLHSGMRVVLKDGRKVTATMVMHQGEQISAAQMSKPRVGRVYAVGRDGMIDFTPDEIDVPATIAANEEAERRRLEFEAMVERNESPYTVTPEVEEELKKQSSTDVVNGFKRGDKVVYTPSQRTGEPTEATIHDFEPYGSHKPVLDTGMGPVIYEVAEWADIKPVNSDENHFADGREKIDITNPTDEQLGAAVDNMDDAGKLALDIVGYLNPELAGTTKAKAKETLMRTLKKSNAKVLQDEIADPNIDQEIRKIIEDELNNREKAGEKKPRSKKKSVPSQTKVADLFSDLFADEQTSIEDNTTPAPVDTSLQRKFALTVKSDMLSALDTDTKPYRSIIDLRKRASELGMEVDNDGRTDILLQELVEDGLVRAAREVVKKYGRDSRESYDLVCKLYDMQPTIAARSSNRIKMQQYSTPLPMSWIADRFAMEAQPSSQVLEPTAGNGMLVFTVPVEQVHVNELDETRLDNLREQGFAQVTQQDATEPFEGGKKYDAVIANPPFGKREAVEYDGKMIPGLDPQITLNALASMKDDGRAAIIIGGNMEYANNGGLKGLKPFFTYLYDHYNVSGVIDMDGKLYAKQGTTFPTRMILINGRRSEEERAQTAIYPPVQSKALRKAESFEDLYEILNEVLNSNEKTNGTEILRSRERKSAPVNNQPSGKTDGEGHREQPRKNDTSGRGERGERTNVERSPKQSEGVLRGERRENTGNGEDRNTPARSERGDSGRSNEPDTKRVAGERVSPNGVGLKTEQKKRTLTEEKLSYRPHNGAFSLNSVAPAAMVEAMDNVLSQIEEEYGNIDEFIKSELGYATIEEAHAALAAEQMDSVAMAIYQMKKGQALIIGDQTGVGKGRQMAALIRWAVMRGEKPVFITQKADLFSDIYRDLVDVGSGDLKPFIFNSDGAMVDAKGNAVHKPLSQKEMAKVFASGELPEDYDFAVLTYSQVNTGDAISQQELEEAAKKRGARVKKSKASKEGKATPKATFLRAIAKDNYLFLDESHTAAGSSNTGAYLQSILRSAKAATFASATFAKRPDTMPLYAIRTAMSQAKVEPDKMIGIIEKGGVTLQEIMSRELTNAGQMVRRERDMSDVKTDWKTITDPETVKRARENYDKTISAFNAIVKFQEDYVKPKIEELAMELAITAESAGVKRGTDKMGVENVPFASKTYNYTKQLMLALKVDAIADEVEAEINAGRHPVIALESTMESTIKDYSAGDVIAEPTFSASLLKGLDSVMQYTVKDEDGKERHAYYTPKQLGEAGEKAYYELQQFIRESTSGIFISPLDAIIERLHEKGYKVGELTGRNMYVERNAKGEVVVKRRTDKDKKKMQREFNDGTLDVLILNKSASTGISLHASERFSDQRQRTMIIAQPLSDINDYMQMIGRIDRTGQVHRGYYINLGLPVPAENRFLMMLSTKLKSLNANTTTSQDSESNEVEAPDLLNKYGSQVVVEYLRDNVEVYEKMGAPLKKAGAGAGRVQASELEEYKPQEDDARKVTGYVALLSTKEQEEFYDDVVRRYNELIKYLNDTGSNDLKISVMPLRAATLDKRVSSEGIDPNGNNPFARNSYVEKVEMDVLRKPMKAEEVKKVIAQINNGNADEHLHNVRDTIHKEDEARIAAENERYEKAKSKAAEDIAKQTEKINRQQKRTAEEKSEAIARVTADTNERVEAKHQDNMIRLNSNSDQLLRRLDMFEVGKSYLVPETLESMVFDFASPAIFCGYKTKDKKITASTTLAVFATLDGRRRVEVKLSDGTALTSIDRMTNENWDSARSTTLDNWDSQIPNETRKQGFIMTGNILQAIADTQDEHGGYPGQLISYTDIDGNVHDGILMPDKWNASMLKTSGAPISSRLQQIKQYETVTSSDGKVRIEGSSWSNMHYLTIPKSKKDGAQYYENADLLKAAGGNFYPYRGQLRADIPTSQIDKVVAVLSRLGVKVKGENEEDVLYRSDDTMYRIREDEAPKKTGIGYKVFVLKNGQLYPPMVANPNGAATPVGVWLDADAAPIAGQSKTGRNQVKAGGKGTQGGSGKLAYRPGWHLGEIPYALQFNRLNPETGEKELFPANFVWAEVEYANDVDYQEEAMSYGYNASGKFQHSLAGLPKLPVNGAYRYRTNPNPETDPWIITGAMRVKRLLTPSEVDKMVEDAGREPQPRQAGAITDEQISALNEEFANDYRNGDGAYSDDALSYENDPIAKWTGKSSRSKAQRRVFAQRERQRMEVRVNELVEKLGLNNVEVVTDASTLEGEKQRAKGFYSKSTGKITIVVPNHANVFDVEQTLLHEAVAHYGLRQLFGEHFDTFLDNVFNNADESIRREIVEMAKKHDWDFRTATEEYLAGLAENTDFERTNASWWNKIKSWFLDMLHNIGFEGFTGVTLTDNELRYILWRSYENLAEPGRYRSILGEAADVAMQHELKVGNYQEQNSSSQHTAVADDALFRDGDPEVHERVLARDRYEERVKRGMFQTQEALQDSMLGLREAMNAILRADGIKENIEDVKGFENAYLGENRLSSVNKAEADAFAHLVFKPMLDEVAKLAKTEAEREELTDYMMAKHGLERNIVMAERDFIKYQQENPNGTKTLDDFRERDYAGLTALTGMDDVADAEAEAQTMVSGYELNHDTADLWEKINAVNAATLSKTYECGMMSKETYESVKSMYEYYIPLRGFDEKTSNEAYAYLTDKHSAFNVPIKKAQGRSSKADDPFANMQSMAESAIMQGNRNKLVKQRFLNFVLNHPSDLASVSDLWIQYDDVMDEWKPVFPDNIETTDTPDEVEKKMIAFNEKMEQLRQSEPDKYKRGKDAVGIPYRVVESGDLRQHQIVVKRNGRDYIITINGNPRAAQALNGQTNPDNDMSGAIGAVLRGGEKINRQLSAFYTTRNPDFVISNFMRDMLYTNTMVWIKESPNYALRFNRNVLSVNPAKMKSLLAKHRKGELDMNDPIEQMFHQFMMNGGETGYANIRDIEQHKNDICRELKKANSKIPVRRAWDLLGERFDEYNRAVENCARFAAFITSRQFGRSIDRAIYDAKEISVNFNKKGSGAKFYDAVGQTKLSDVRKYVWRTLKGKNTDDLNPGLGNTAALLSGLGRSGFVFWNAAIQGTTNFGRQAKRHPAKALTAVATMFLLGALMAYMNGDDDDDDKNAYYNLPDHVRRSNLLFRAGEHWISLPLPQEYRAIYGMGELMLSVLSGKEHYTDGELAEKIMGQISQVLPLDIMEGGGGLGAFVPSSVKPLAEAYVMEKSWTGMPLYKNTPYNKDMPEWTKAYKSANKYIVWLAETMNEVTGGDPYTKGTVDINPAKVEYMLNGYFGGVFSTIDKMVKTGETIFGDREYDPRSVLLANRLLKAGDERTEFRAINNEYFRLKEEHDQVKKRLKHYENDTDNGVFDYAEKIDFLYNSPEFARYEIFEDYRRDIDDLYEELKEAANDEEYKEVEAELNALKKEMIHEMNETRNRK